MSSLPAADLSKSVVENPNFLLLSRIEALALNKEERTFSRCQGCKCLVYILEDIETSWICIRWEQGCNVDTT